MFEAQRLTSFFWKSNDHWRNSTRKTFGIIRLFCIFWGTKWIMYSSNWTFTINISQVGIIDSAVSTVFMASLSNDASASPMRLKFFSASSLFSYGAILLLALTSPLYMMLHECLRQWAALLLEKSCTWFSKFVLKAFSIATAQNTPTSMKRRELKLWDDRAKLLSRLACQSEKLNPVVEN